MDVELANNAPLIQFDQEEQNGPGIPGNDALVITALLANYEIERVFIDSGSSADILFAEAYDQMQLGDVPLEAVDTSLYGSLERLSIQGHDLASIDLGDLSPSEDMPTQVSGGRYTIRL
ncbi:UNVERIFIED_CONTAM: hypothetical protein Slati_2895500 [Sesamum latifolium]|uniref:Uncharacterized protein n=1 Tax=Sesamum latifolium TaxID=2727402 RepID=A0AAW2VDD5_9LAMI